MLASLVWGFAVALWVAAPAAASDTPGVPTSTVKSVGDGTATYCVRNYAPNDRVAVRNERNGQTTTIRATHRGTGCTDVEVETACGEVVTQTIVATGVGADGSPGTSSARVAVPSNAPGCAPGQAGAEGGSTGLSGGQIVLVALAGAGGLGLVAGGVVLIRRRRTTAVE